MWAIDWHHRADRHYILLFEVFVLLNTHQDVQQVVLNLEVTSTTRLLKGIFSWLVAIIALGCPIPLVT